MRSGGASLGRLAELLGCGEDRPRALRLLEAAALARMRDPCGLYPGGCMPFIERRAAWACIDPACSKRQAEFATEGSDWPWGRVHLEGHERCGCGALVYEVAACDECGTPWLFAALERGAHERLHPRRAGADDEDDYQLDVEPDEEGGTPSASADVLLGPARPDLAALELRLADAVLLSRADVGERTVRLRLVEEPRDRGCCGRSHEFSVRVRPQRFGAPFLMGNAMPVLLEASTPGEQPAASPAGGRRLLSFTDSRQGTARFSAKLQQEAERSLTRATIYHAVQASGRVDADLVAQLLGDVAGLEEAVATVPSLAGMLEERRRELTATEAGGRAALTWPMMIDALARQPELGIFATEVWQGRDDAPRTPTELAEFFLLRELFRRPRVQNNVETMGLARLEFPELSARARLGVPRELSEAGLDATAWATCSMRRSTFSCAPILRSRYRRCWSTGSARKVPSRS